MSNHPEEIQTRLDLVAHLFLIYLGKASLLDDDPNIKYNEQTKKHIEFHVNVDQTVASFAFGANIESLEVILMDMSRGEKCMISLCSKEESLQQGIFNYDSDLSLKESLLEFPISKSDAIQFFNPQVQFKLQQKFGLMQSGLSAQDLQAGAERELQQQASTKKEIEKLKFGALPTLPISHNHGNPSDMPGFEDEYEAQGQPSIPVTGEFGVPGLGMPSRNPGYGDKDLYPTGEKYPNLQNPLLPNPGSGIRGGGMIFDPFQGGSPSPNPLKGDPNNPNKSLPPFPGARFDDPYGRTSHQGGGSGFI